MSRVAGSGGRYFCRSSRCLRSARKRVRRRVPCRQSSGTRMGRRQQRGCHGAFRGGGAGPCGNPRGAGFRSPFGRTLDRYRRSARSAPCLPALDLSTAAQRSCSSKRRRSRTAPTAARRGPRSGEAGRLRLGASNYNSAAPQSTDPAPEGRGRIARATPVPVTFPPKGERNPAPLGLPQGPAPPPARSRDNLSLRGPDRVPLFVDTGPVVERVYARYAGVGWIRGNPAS